MISILHFKIDVKTITQNYSFEKTNINHHNNNYFDLIKIQKIKHLKTETRNN